MAGPKSTDLQSAWEFVGDYYPDYSRSQDIGENDLLQRVVDLEFDPEDPEDSATQKYKEISGNFGSDEEEVVLWEAKRLLYESNSEIYERAIAEYMKAKKPIEKTYYLFGKSQSNSYTEGIDILLEHLTEQEEEAHTFVFTEGITPSWELAEAMDGWNDYALLTEADYLKIQEHEKV